MKYSTWNHIFVLLAPFLDPRKSCRNSVEACTKWGKLSVFEKEYLNYDWTSDAKILMADVK